VGTGLTTRVPRNGVAPLMQAWMGVLAMGVIAALVYKYDTRLALAAAVAVGSFVAMLIRPELATLVVVFLLYSNIPAVLDKVHGVPEVLAGSFILLLLVPLAHFVVLQHQRLRVDAVFMWMIALLCAMLLSSFVAKDIGIAMGRVQKYVAEGMLVYWLILNTVRDPATLRRVVWAVLAAGTMLGSMSIYQSATGDFTNQFGGLAARNLRQERENAELEEPVVREEMDRSVIRAQGPQLEKNRYAQVMLVLAPLAWMQFRNARGRRGRICAIVMGGLILIGGVGLTYSRGAYVALTLMAVTATFVVRWIRPAQLAALALSGLLVLPIVAPLTFGRLTTLTAVTDLDDPSAADGSLRGRATEMLAGFNALLDHPVLGVGPGQYAPFYSVEYQQQSVQFRDLEIPRRAHILYFEIGAEGGVIGLTCFLAIPLLLLRELGRERRYWVERRLDYANLASACLIGISGFLVTALFLSHAFERFYWFLIALSGTTLFLLRAESPLRERAAAGAQSIAQAKQGFRQPAMEGRGA
jgi:putative inorganic carbon (HCO3(-)) transporter